ncbi:hypothetical protein N7474_001447 [Penicillium riverlandense]|uniref:uncharacterized protein n=1 Tax=Penicillium riverlandense TaxID=1903569 RepID=UPI00254991B8|nr:uncharacterized protein N7474_001447 [Penicillium riverlandense]KAJ5833136.1 hypothetical protein N7474_001447 [Penicillium riverlandense]
MFIDQLITELTHHTRGGEGQSQLDTLKPLMLTLHCLFPNDLLLALDLLDRRLVRHLVPTIEEDVSPTSDQDIFLVMSASTVPPPGVSLSSSTFTQHQKGYEVRLGAWNCTCPTFALSAFREVRPTADAEPVTPEMVQDQTSKNLAYPFGGTLTRPVAEGAFPICKHILACVLFARCPGLFAPDEDGRCAVSRDELAGWCAGWGG